MTTIADTIEAVWRIESARLLASMVRLVRDVGLAEDLAQETFAAAWEAWSQSGPPPNPRAWLLTTARHKAIDVIRREQNLRTKYAVLAIESERDGADPDDLDPDDDLLALIFTAAHPVLPRESRVALTLRLLGGLTTDEIARAFLTPSATIGQRISRAKRTLTEAHVPFAAPIDDELTARLSSVLEVVYLIFNEGYAATSGDAWIRRDLAREAMRLGRVLTGLLPRQPEAHGLLALMEIQASRFDARVDPAGQPVLLADQDRRRWDRTLIRHALGALDRAIGLGRPLGPYTLQAAIAACHARAATFAATDWEAIVSLYDALGSITPSPVVELNRAVAVLYADGPRAALDALDAVADDRRLQRLHLYGAVRGDVLLKLDRRAEAAEVLERAADLAPTAPERDLLMARAAAASEGGDQSSRSS